MLHRVLHSLTGEPIALPGELAMEPMPVDHRVHAHTATLERIGFLTQLADGKAAPLLALQAALAGATIAGLDRVRALLSGEHGSAAAAGSVVLLLAYIGCAITVSLLTLAIYFPVSRPTGGTVTFFNDIQAMPQGEFELRSRALSHGELERDLLRQIHAASGIAAAKFRQLRWAYVLSGIGIAAWLPLMVWGSF